jgi:hypothetical protein
MDRNTKAVSSAAGGEAPCCGKSARSADEKVQPPRTSAEPVTEQQPMEQTGSRKGKSKGCCCGGG